MPHWLITVLAIAVPLTVAVGAWAVGAGYDAWRRRHHRAPVLDLLMKTWQAW